MNFIEILTAKNKREVESEIESKKAIILKNGEFDLSILNDIPQPKKIKRELSEEQKALLTILSEKEKKNIVDNETKSVKKKLKTLAEGDNYSKKGMYFSALVDNFLE